MLNLFQCGSFINGNVLNGEEKGEMIAGQQWRQRQTKDFYLHTQKFAGKVTDVVVNSVEQWPIVAVTKTPIIEETPG